jgi:hypothetical protein
MSKMKNGNNKKTETKPKPKYSIHDYKPKKRYTRAEREKIEAGMLLLELIRRGKEEDESK